MTEPMSYEKQQLLIAGYVLGNLSAEEAADLSRQLAADPLLWQQVQHLQASLEAGFAPAEVAPPARLGAAILEKAQTASAQTGAQPSVVRQARSAAEQRVALPTWVKVWSAIAALTIAGLSFSNFLLWRSSRGLRLATDTQPDLEITLEPVDAATTASATLSADPDTLQATLSVENLPPLPADQVYVLWTVLEENAAYTTDDKNAVLTQVFTVDEQGQFTEEILLPRAYRESGLIEAIAITAEDANAPQRHESSPILISQ